MKGVIEFILIFLSLLCGFILNLNVNFKFDHYMHYLQ